VLELIEQGEEARGVRLGERDAEFGGVGEQALGRTQDGSSCASSAAIDHTRGP